MLVFIIYTFNYSVIDAKSTRPSVMWNGKLFNISQDCYLEKYWYMPPEAQELLEADKNAYKQMLYLRRVNVVSDD